MSFQEFGNLQASVICFGGSSGNPITIATIVPAPTITISSIKLAISIQFLTIFGNGFDNSSLNSTQVSLSFIGGIKNPNCDIYSITPNQIICTNLYLQETGLLTAIIFAFDGKSEISSIVANIIEHK